MTLPAYIKAGTILKDTQCNEYIVDRSDECDEWGDAQLELTAISPALGVMGGKATCTIEKLNELRFEVK